MLLVGFGSVGFVVRVFWFCVFCGSVGFVSWVCAIPVGFGSVGFVGGFWFCGFCGPWVLVLCQVHALDLASCSTRSVTKKDT